MKLALRIAFVLTLTTILVLLSLGLGRILNEVSATATPEPQIVVLKFQVVAGKATDIPSLWTYATLEPNCPNWVLFDKGDITLDPPLSAGGGSFTCDVIEYEGLIVHIVINVVSPIPMQTL